MRNRSTLGFSLGSLLMVTQAMAVDVCVQTAADLTATLQQITVLPATPAQQHFIRIVEGQHIAPAGGWQVTVPAGHGLTILGGWNVNNCNGHVHDASLTMLDGNNQSRRLKIIASGASNITLAELTFGHGAISNPFPDNFGGGLWIGPPNGLFDPALTGNIDIFDNIFLNNTVTTPGFAVGGGLVAGTDGILTVANNLFIGNSAIDDAAAFFWNTANGTTFVKNNTFSGNRHLPGGQGQFFAIHYDTLGQTPAIFANNIFWDNLVAGQPTFDIDLTNNITLVNNDIQAVGNGTLPASNVSVDPKFIMPGNFRLSPHSPLIDAGDLNAAGGPVSPDLDGLPRVVNGTIDLGAYESNYSVICAGTAAELTTALATAQDDGFSNQIRIRTNANPYMAPVGGWQFVITDKTATYIEGGYTDTNCTTRSMDASLTVLDGGSTERPLTITTTAFEPASHIAISGLTFQNGQGDSGAGLQAGRMLQRIDPTSVLIERNIFQNNNGEGLSVASDTWDGIIIRNNLIVNNTALTNAGGFFMNDISGLFIANNTFANNQSTNASPSLTVRVTGRPILTNNIFWGNTNTNGNSHVDLEFDSPFTAFVTIKNNDIQSSSGTADVEQNTFNTDPLFIDAAGGDFRLSSVSPLIGKGNNNPAGETSAVDLDGYMRLDNIIDLGAYEFADSIFKDSFD